MIGYNKMIYLANKKMWNKEDEIKKGTLNIEVWKSESANISDKYDLAVVFNSFDSRSLEYSNLFSNKPFKYSIIISFQSDKVQKRQNLQKHLQYMEVLSNNHPIVIEDIDIFDYHKNLNHIFSIIPSETIGLKSKWFIDISGVPTIYTIAILKKMRMTFPTPELHCLNVSGEYKSDVPTHKQFTGGYSREIYVPYYSGNPDFSKPWRYVFLLGWEGTRSLSVLKKCEPDFVDVVITNPGYKDGYEKRVLENNKSFLFECRVSEDNYIEVDAGNPVQLIREIESIYNKTKRQFNICIVPLGVKPHGLGAGLFGCINNDVSVMYHVPKKYKLHEIERGKYIWLYKIK